MLTPGHKLSHGGKRPGSGRKPFDVRKVRELVEQYEVQATANEGGGKKPLGVWCADRLVEAARDPDVSPQQVQALKYLMNQTIGAPRQTMQMEIRETDKSIGNIEAALAAADPKNAKKLSAEQ